MCEAYRTKAKVLVSTKGWRTVSDLLSAKIAILFDKGLCGMLKCLNSDKNKIEIVYLSRFSIE